MKKWTWIIWSDKITGLRIFEDAERKMNRSLLDTQGSLLVISQFTLLGNVKKGQTSQFRACGQASAGATFVSRNSSNPVVS